jgi:biopolymer transport protein ExbD
LVIGATVRRSTSSLDCFMALWLRFTVLFFVFMVGSACQKGDPTVACRGDTDSTNCSVVPLRDHSDHVIQVGIQRDGTCTIDKVVVACSNVGKQIRASHPLENPRVKVCGDPNVAFDVIGGVLKALTNEDLPSMFGCTQER